MSKLKLEPGVSTPIPNIFFDYWQPKLTRSEFSILMCLSRHYFDSEQDFVAVSLRQLASLTGMTKDTVTRAVRSLEAIGLITKTKFAWHCLMFMSEFKVNILYSIEEKPCKKHKS